jgi:LPXTG-site transpeptidase (sortase) family protein
LWLERALLAVGIACLAYYGYQTVEARNAQSRYTAAFEASLEIPPGEQELTDGQSSVASPSPSSGPADMPGERRRAGTVAASGLRAGTSLSAEHGAIAMLDIPRLDLSSPILSGDDAEILDVAIGHLPDTPKPWEPGNSALAAHRDGIFRSLRRVRIGDALRVRTRHGEFLYRVRETQIVEPNDLSVLAPTDVRTLTLITCYPFNFVGSAPQRFVVRAEQDR